MLAIPHAVNHVLPYGAAIVAGTLVTALALGLPKKPLPPVLADGSGVRPA